MGTADCLLLCFNMRKVRRTLRVSQYPDAVGRWLVYLENGDTIAILCSMFTCDDNKDRLDWSDGMDGVIKTKRDNSEFDLYWGKPKSSVKVPDDLLVN